MTENRLRELLRPFTDVEETSQSTVPDDLYVKLEAYLDLLLRWNARINLTAVRDPDEIVTRHFGEGVFTALRLRPHRIDGARLLDVGSGAGFPGLPIHLALPDLQVTLTESQGKKASFLREVVRVLGLPTRVWPDRVESLPAEQQFHFVSLRAVDRMEKMVPVAAQRLLPGGILVELAGAGSQAPAHMEEMVPPQALPNSEQRVLRLWKLPFGGNRFHVEQLEE